MKSDPTTTNENTTTELETKYQHLQDLLAAYPRVIVAYSGGVDSVFLLKAALDKLGSENVLACIGVSASLAQSCNKPAPPCLASRMPYGFEITPDRLNQIEQGEEFLRNLGLRELRVRNHGDLVRIEVPPTHIAELTDEDKRHKIVTFFKKLGFTYISLDLQGFRSGSANEALKKP